VIPSAIKSSVPEECELESPRGTRSTIMVLSFDRGKTKVSSFALTP
jgi:hypothetical protein